MCGCLVHRGTQAWDWRSVWGLILHLGPGLRALSGIMLLKSPGWNLAIEKLLAISQPLSYSEGTGDAGLGPLLGMSGKSH